MDVEFVDDADLDPAGLLAEKLVVASGPWGGGKGQLEKKVRGSYKKSQTKPYPATREAATIPISFRFFTSNERSILGLAISSMPRLS